MPAAQSFGGGAAASGGAPAPAAGAASGGGGAAPPRQQRQRAKRGQATDPHSIAERVRHSPSTAFPFSLLPPFFNASASLCTCMSPLCSGLWCSCTWSSTTLGPCSLTCQPQTSIPLLQFELQTFAPKLNCGSVFRYSRD